jgi:NADH-quinone oxidoreductase E subunit
MAFAFTDEYERQFQWLLTRYPTKQACLLPALRLVEAQQGFIDDEAKDYVAGRLELSPAFVHGVFTFYSHYRRASDGKYVVMVCMTLPCALRGAGAILAAFEEHIGIKCGQTGSDGLFTLRKVECLGACFTAPVAQINDDYFENLTPEKVRDIVLALKRGMAPPHLSNGPTLNGGCQCLKPLVEACPGGSEA